MIVKIMIADIFRAYVRLPLTRTSEDYTLLPPFNKRGTSSERYNNVPKDTQLESHRASILSSSKAYLLTAAGILQP